MASKHSAHIQEVPVRAIPIAALIVAAATPVLAQTGPNTTPNTASSAGTVATANSANSEKITFRHGATVLNGTIENATTDGQHGAVLILSDAQSATTAQQLAKAFAAQGIVALTYDAQTPNMDDAAAALTVLRQRGDVAQDKIGIVALNASDIEASCAKTQKLRYAVAIDKNIVPGTFAKLSQRVLIINPTDDAFSESAEKLKQSVEKKNKNVTLWATPQDDVNTMTNADSQLMSRVLSWAAERNS